MFAPVPLMFMPTDGRRIVKADVPRLLAALRVFKALFSTLVAVLVGGGGGAGGGGGVGIFGVDKHMIIQFFLLRMFSFCS